MSASVTIDRTFMRLALREAKKGQGRTMPNPCVGAVVIKDGQVVGKGYHRRAGTPHAEVHALAAAGEAARGATIYVTLEPCSHFGRTPPCCEALVAAGIARVVVGMVDPNPLVAGKGVTYLQRHGLEVVTGVLEEACLELNRPFCKYITSGRPLFVMKGGLSVDGRLAYREGTGGRITGEKASRRVHRLRNIYDAIMVGSGTILADDPSLTTRGIKGGRDPIRVVLDSSLQTRPDHKVVNSSATAPLYIFCAPTANPERRAALEDAGCRVISVAALPTGLDMSAVANHLAECGITSVLVEGGALIHGSLVQSRLFDYAHLFIAPLFIGDRGVPLLSGYQAEDRQGAVRLAATRIERLGEDFLLSGEVVYPLGPQES